MCAGSTLIEFEAGNSTVTTTEDHEFWNVTDQQWQQTQHIDEGDYLLTADGQTVEAGNLLWDTAHHAAAYDLTIDQIHTYHITAGDKHVLVHNTGIRDCLTDAQAQVIEDYTSGLDEDINTWLRDENPEPGLFETEVDLLTEALEEIAPFEGQTFRGTNTLPRSLNPENLRVGDRYIDEAFTSSDLVTPFEGRFQITIEGSSGRDISDLSLANGEAEVLFLPATEFRITAVTPRIEDGVETISITMVEQ